MLSQKLAKQIIEETMKRLNKNINIMDETGTIIASGDSVRINQIHEGALEVIKFAKSLIITKKNIDKFKGAHLGINLPIEFQGRVVGVIGITGVPEQVEEFGGLVKMTTEIMINQRYIMLQTEWKHRMKDKLLKELIKKTPNNENIKTYISMLEINLCKPLCISIIRLTKSSSQIQMIIQLIIDTIHQKKVLVGQLGTDKIIMLYMGFSMKMIKSIVTMIDNKLIKKKIYFKMGISSREEDQTKLYILRNEATLALLASEDYNLAYFSDTEAKSLIFQIDKEMQQRYLKQSIQDLDNDMIETLETFFSNDLNITKAAKDLFIHRNTLVYRLQRIKGLTGYNPTIFQDAFSLMIAVIMNKNLDIN